AATGKGHLTDQAITQVLDPVKVNFVWQPKTFLDRHPNALTFEALDDKNEVVASKTAYSIGGGAIGWEGETEESETIYPHRTMSDILRWCDQEGRTLWEYVQLHETYQTLDHLIEVWHVMQDAVRRGLENEGV